MRSVLLASRAPWPPIGGDRLRTFQLARALATLGPVTVVCAGAPSAELARGLPFAERVLAVPSPRLGAAARVLRALPSRRPLQQALYDSPGLRAATAQACDGADVVVAHLLRTAPWLPSRPPPVVLCLQDALAAQAEEASGAGGWSGGWRRLALRVERPRLHSAELSAGRDAALVTAITARDRDLLVAAGLQADRVRIVPARVERIAAAPHEDPHPDTVVFAGNLRTASNRDMAVHLARRVLPLVRAERPRARLQLVGVEAPPEVLRLDRLAGVQVVGRVEDMHATLARAWVTACPLRFGSGVQNKVLESLAAGTPIVASPRVLDTLHADAGHSVLTGADDHALARQLIAVLGDRARRRQLGEAGIAFVTEHHGASALDPLLDAIRDLAAAPRR